MNLADLLPLIAVIGIVGFIGGLYGNWYDGREREDARRRNGRWR
jgi:hypothetical protein